MTEVAHGFDGSAASPSGEWSSVKCSSGIAGLDVILRGGFSRGRWLLLQGAAGTGKTTIGTQFLLEGAKHGEAGLHVTLSESRAELVELVRSHGWPEDRFAIFEMDFLGRNTEPQGQYSFFQPAEVEFLDILKSLYAEIQRVRPARLVLDSLSELRMVARDSLRFRREILRLKRDLSEMGCTVLVLDRHIDDQASLRLESVVTGVIRLGYETPLACHGKRHLGVVKMRASAVDFGRHDFHIRRGGVAVFPQIVANDPTFPEWESPKLSKVMFSTGDRAMDLIFGGGLSKGESTLIVGPSGSGKSCIVAGQVWAAISRGERARIFLFDETLSSFFERSRALGMDFLRPDTRELLTAERVNLAVMSAGEFIQRVADSARGGAALIVLDSLNRYLSAMPPGSFALQQLQELFVAVGQLGSSITSVLVADHFMETDDSKIRDLGVMVDTTALTGFYEDHGSRKKTIEVVKRRTGTHSSEAWELVLAPLGVTVKPKPAL